MIIYNKLDNYFFVSADRLTFLGFEMTANLRDTSPLNILCGQYVLFVMTQIFFFLLFALQQICSVCDKSLGSV